jgi:hypothetical protein
MMDSEQIQTSIVTHHTGLFILQNIVGSCHPRNFADHQQASAVSQNKYCISQQLIYRKGRQGR